MRIFCAIAGHKRGGRVLRNRAVEFGRCRRCGCDLVRRKGGRWKEPKGYRIRWPAGFMAGHGSGKTAIKLPDRSPLPITQTAPRQAIARISIYRPDPKERDFMEDDGEDLFWDVPIAAHSAFVHRVPEARVAKTAGRRRRW